MRTNKFILIVIYTLLICMLCACGTENDENQINTSLNSIEETSVLTTTGVTEPMTTEKPSLSAQCDKVLALGVDAEGNLFELVANETESYQGIVIEIGVIKNNDWSVPLTTDSPFIGDTGLLSMYTPENNVTGSIYDSEYAIFKYIGDGCFIYNNDIWNGNNGTYYKCRDNDSYSPVVKSVINNDGVFLLSKYSENYRILDAKTMKIKEIPLREDGHKINYAFPISEGLFACMNKYADVETNGFYDTDGNKVIDLGQYSLASNTYTSGGGIGYTGTIQTLAFTDDGTCTFVVTNELNTKYEITIDKSGNVISSKEA